jgi:uncharacterized membrane protein YdjX (TVP38/TMEM64 family)
VSEWLIGTVSSVQGQAWAPYAFVAVFAAACLAAPVSLFPVMGSVLFGFWGGLAASMAGALAGASLAFAASRRWGHPAMERVMGERWRRWTSALPANAGFKTILAARLCGLPPFGVANYLAGLTGVRWRDYLAATAAGILPWTLLLTYSGDTLWAAFTLGGHAGFRGSLLRLTRPFLVAALLAAGAILGSMWAGKRRGTTEGR